MIIRSACRIASPRLGRPCGRNQSSTSSSLQQWIKEITSTPSVHYDTLDSLRAAQLLRTLPTRQDRANVRVQEGDILDHGHHMIYFQPETMLKDLGQDGSSPEYNAPSPYTRRMWAGGSMHWPHPLDTDYDSRILRTGSNVFERRSVDKVEVKKGMVFVHQRREVSIATSTERAGDGWGVQEIRTHVFRPPVTPLEDDLPTSAASASNPARSSTTSGPVLASSANPPSSTSNTANLSATKWAPNTGPSASASATASPSCSFTYIPSSPLLFRYSALTFNAHRIHYDHPHTLSIESQPNLLVHGPLTATLLIELAAKYAKERGKSLVKFEYRAVSPVVVDREVVMRGWAKELSQMGKQGQRRDGIEMKMTAEQGGRVGMKATAIMA